MSDLKFDVLQNPNGILYDPLSISSSIHSYIFGSTYKAEDLISLNGLWHSWAHHSRFSGSNKAEALQQINQSQINAHHFLKEAKFLVITLGTAFIHELKSNKQPVANCHKAPANFFDKKLLSTQEITLPFLKMIDALQIFNPGLHIIITISPVKHIKDGVVENSLSKARLIDAAHSVIEKSQKVDYFPSYELVTDVLRDYRFYKNDLVHPNDAAVEFVFEKFYNTLISSQSKLLAEKIKRIISAVNHKPFAPQSDNHQQFINTQLDQISQIEMDYPFINLSKERDFFRRSKIK